MFDRDDEWNDLARFAMDGAAGATLGVVSGRRRQGKTLLLYSLAQATGAGSRPVLTLGETKWGEQLRARRFSWTSTGSTVECESDGGANG